MGEERIKTDEELNAEQEALSEEDLNEVSAGQESAAKKTPDHG
jgi:hypothetical protein